MQVQVKQGSQHTSQRSSASGVLTPPLDTPLVTHASHASGTSTSPLQRQAQPTLLQQLTDALSREEAVRRELAATRIREQSLKDQLAIAMSEGRAGAGCWRAGGQPQASA
jgi:hypothetical protein